MNTFAVLCGLVFLRTIDAQSCSSYTCDNGQCTFFINRCDGFMDCSDGSDERGCFSCPNTFPCKSGGCTVSIFDRCNEISECSDRSDEANCGTSTSIESSTTVIVGATIGAFMFVFVFGVCTFVFIFCFVFCQARAAASVAGNTSRHNPNIHTNIVPAEAPIMTTTTTTTTEAAATDAPAYPEDSILQQEPPPSYADARVYPQPPNEACSLKPVETYSHQPPHACHSDADSPPAYCTDPNNIGCTSPQ